MGSQATVPIYSSGAVVDHGGRRATVRLSDRTGACWVQVGDEDAALVKVRMSDLSPWKEQAEPRSAADEQVIERLRQELEAMNLAHASSKARSDQDALELVKADAKVEAALNDLVTTEMKGFEDARAEMKEELERWKAAALTAEEARARHAAAVAVGGG